MQRIQNIWNSSIDRNYVHENNDSITEDNSDIEKSGDDMNVNKNDDNKVPIFHPRRCVKNSVFKYGHKRPFLRSTI